MIEKSNERHILSTSLKNRTAIVHLKAESSEFMRKLFLGDFDDGEYLQYLIALQHIYRSLELMMRKNKHYKLISPIYFEELFRLDALVKDIAFHVKNAPIFLGEELTEAIEEYVSHLDYIGSNEPHLLIAHAYTRYLGDLSGGMILGKVLRSRYLSDEGLAFYLYDFTNIQSMKSHYKHSLDRIPLTKTEFEQVCEEAILSFEFNEKVFKSILPKGH